MRKSVIIAAIALSAGIALTSCKTTVDNYQAAYDIAKQKDQGDLDNEIYAKIKAEEAPKVTVVNGDSIRTKVEPLSRLNPDGSRTAPSQKFNVVVGVYKIRVNANAHVEQLIEQGYKAFLLKNTESQFYVVAEAFDDIDEAAKFVKAFEKKHSGQYVGVEQPVVITPSHLMKRF